MGEVAFVSHGDHRLALLATTAFLIAGLLLTVDERRGRAAAVNLDSKWHG